MESERLEYFPGTRLSIRHIGAMAERGDGAIEEILDDYPYLTYRDVRLAMLLVQTERERERVLTGLVSTVHRLVLSAPVPGSHTDSARKFLRDMGSVDPYVNETGAPESSPPDATLASLREWLAQWGEGPNWSDATGQTVPIAKHTLSALLDRIEDLESTRTAGDGDAVPNGRRAR